MKNVTTLFVAVTLLFGLAESSQAFSTGPPAGHAGDPPLINTCRNCHDSFDLNSGDGMLDLSGITTYQPGETYTLTVSLSDPGQQRWGFQIIAKELSDNIPQGTFIITDPTNTQLNNGYVNHTSTGTNNGDPDGNTWTFDWTAPNFDVGPISFYYTGNAANGNGNNQGDYIYRTWTTVEVEAAPYEFTVLPTDDFIPAGGGSIDYTITLVTNLPQSYNGVDFWTTVTLPNGNEYGPITSINNLTIPASVNISQTFTLDVPGFAPSGDYVHNSKLGFYPNDVIVASWNFFKAASATDGMPVHTWADRGSFVELASDATEAAVATVPSAYELRGAYPNPFNSMTTVTVALPEAADLTLSVFNVLGETVATLAEGRYTAGVQEFSLNADQFSSGVYFVRATVPGHLNKVQKVMLVR